MLFSTENVGGRACLECQRGIQVMMPIRVCCVGQSVTERSEAIMKVCGLPWWWGGVGGGGGWVGRENEQRSTGVAEG